MHNHLMTASRTHIRLVQAADLPAVDQVQRACYPEHYHEPIASFAARLRLSPESCWLAERQDVILGYFFTHPWAGDELPALGKPLQQLPTSADTHFLHDLAVVPQARGSGIAPALVAAALSWGAQRGLPYCRLVAVPGAASFWLRWGFHPGAAAPAYGDGAMIMSKEAG